MCFDTSLADWFAGVSIDTSGTSPFAAKCVECGNRIAPYEWRRHVYQQECEECQRCEYEELGEDEEPCVDHDYGETYQANICETCDKILRAIEQFEAREGCPVDERRPLVGDLRDELNERDDAGLYAAVAIEAYPELGAVDWLTDYLAEKE